MLQFDPKFFEPETRDGFYIEPLIKNVWAAQLETLYRFDKICSEHGLTYSLDWGTLLGAVRHGGYIPWDDDLDVCMPREDLMEFYNIIGNYPELVCLNAYNDPNLGGHATRLNLTKKFLIDRDILKEHFGFPLPVGIDIFSIDYVPRDKSVEAKCNALMLKVSYAINALDCIKKGKNVNGYKEAYRNYIRDIKSESHITFSKSEPDMQELAILYNELEMECTADEADYVTEYQNILGGGNYYLPKDTYNNMIRIPFENINVPVPANYHEVLKKKYGDNYMIPINSGGSHGYPFYDGAIEELVDRFGMKSFEETKDYIVKISSDFYRRFVNRDLDSRLTFSEEMLNLSDNARIQAAMLEVLEEVKRLCKAHNLLFYYIGDTVEEIDNISNLKGQSTDIHIAMNRNDYMNMQRIIQEELDPWFDYRSIYSHSDHIDLRTYIITDAYGTNDGEYEKRFHGCNAIVGIDIAPIDIVNDDDSVEEFKRGIISQALRLAPDMPSTPPYNDMIIEAVKQYEDMLGVRININGNLQNEFVKVADAVAMSDSNDNYSRVRITSDISEGRYELYNKSEFS